MANTDQIEPMVVSVHATCGWAFECVCIRLCKHIQVCMVVYTIWRAMKIHC